MSLPLHQAAHKFARGIAGGRQVALRALGAPMEEGASTSFKDRQILFPRSFLHLAIDFHHWHIFFFEWLEALALLGLVNFQV
jgi:hypothetical protein